MALIPKLVFCLSNSCTELSVSETTGVYNASTNVGGYGTPNATTASVTIYSLVITSPSDQTYTINLFTNGFPTTNEDFEYTIPMSSLGGRSVIEDGFWQFAWSVRAGETTYTGNSAYYFTCNTECCVAELLADITVEEDGCNCNKDITEKVLNYLRVKAFLESLKNAAFCGKLTLFNTIKTAIDKICATTDCRTCN